MTARDRWRLERDLAARHATPEIQEARNKRGRKLVAAAIKAARDGVNTDDQEPIPEPEPADEPAPLELVSCRGCYGPHLGLPGPTVQNAPEAQHEPPPPPGRRGAPARSPRRADRGGGGVSGAGPAAHAATRLCPGRDRRGW